MVLYLFELSDDEFSVKAFSLTVVSASLFPM